MEISSAEEISFLFEDQNSYQARNIGIEVVWKYLNGRQKHVLLCSSFFEPFPPQADSA